MLDTSSYPVMPKPWPRCHKADKEYFTNDMTIPIPIRGASQRYVGLSIFVSDAEMFLSVDPKVQTRGQADWCDLKGTKHNILC